MLLVILETANIFEMLKQLKKNGSPLNLVGIETETNTLGVHIFCQSHHLNIDIFHIFLTTL